VIQEAIVNHEVIDLHKKEKVHLIDQNHLEIEAIDQKEKLMIKVIDQADHQAIDQEVIQVDHQEPIQEATNREVIDLQAIDHQEKIIKVTIKPGRVSITGW